MKVYVYRTSDRTIENGEVREFASLDECVSTLTQETGERDIIVSDIRQYYGDKDVSGCSWLIEIYDWYRE